MTKSKDLNTLLNDQAALVRQLKKKNGQVYNWLVQKGIDFNNLKNNASAFIGAATYLLALPTTAPLPPAEAPIPAVITHYSPSKTPLVSKEVIRSQRIWADYGDFIRESASKYDVDQNLIFATIMIESGGNPTAIRHEPRINDASYGLGQLLYGTARGIGYRGTPEGLYDPKTNIDLIARYHRRNLDHYGHLTAQELTTAYNTGSPYKKPTAGHLAKFNKWYNRIDTWEIDLS